MMLYANILCSNPIQRHEYEIVTFSGTFSCSCRNIMLSSSELFIIFKCFVVVAVDIAAREFAYQKSDWKNNSRSGKFAPPFHSQTRPPSPQHGAKSTTRKLPFDIAAKHHRIRHNDEQDLSEEHLNKK